MRHRLTPAASLRVSALALACVCAAACGNGAAGGAGAARVTIRQVAELAGVSKPLLYMYLGSKDETFSACIARESGRLVETMATIRSSR